MLKLIPVLAIISFQIIGFHRVSASAEAKIVNVKTKNELLEAWKAPKNISSTFPYYVSGFDIEKRPIFIMEVGKWPIREYVERGGQDLKDFSKYLEQFFLRVEVGPKAFFNESEMGADDTALIVDWDNFSLTQFIHGPTTTFILNHFSAFQKIQDSLAYGLWVNVNAVATQFVALARPILGSVMERVEVYGTQKNQWIPKVLRKIHKSQIPAWYGGEKGEFKPVVIYG